MALIELKKINKTFTDGEIPTKVLYDIDLSIQSGEFVSIMGASGSGKSTLMHLLGLLDKPTSGSYELDGQDTSLFTDEEYAAARNANIGFVFQSFYLLARATVLANVIVPLQYSSVEKNEWKDRALQVLDKVGMSHRLDYLPTQLSGGEKQRVAIARALVVSPKIILADEPTGNLDSKNGALVMDLISNLNNNGHTIVLVTHERESALKAKRMLTVKDGRIVEDSLLSSRAI